jgi:hypothetical protein
MASPIDRIDHAVEPEALQEEIRSDPTETDHPEDQDHHLLVTVTTRGLETVPPDVDLHIDALLQETIGEQDLHLEPEVHQEDFLLEEMTTEGSELGHQEMTGISCTMIH